ncbi:MAG TPA: hypothetical protein VHP83_02900 [Aggregatilineaceae bacterium]|nr:hypothetical protein [Aggregatilineaceae bacterium]
MTPFIATRRRWLVLAAFHVTLLIHLTLYLSQSGKGQSRSFRVLALGMSVFALGVIGAALWLTPQRGEMIRQRIGRGRWVILFGGAALLLVFGAEMRPEWVYA